MSSVQEFKDYMRKINASDEIADLLITMLDGETDLNSLIVKIEILADEGININGLEDFFAESGYFFIVAEPKEIEENIAVVKKYSSEKEFDEIIQMTPEYLIAPKGALEQNIKMLQHIMAPENFDVIFKAHGEILTFNSNYLEERLEFLIKNGLQDKLEILILSRIDIFDMDEDEIDLDELK